MKINNKGFTLIELIIAITLMLSLTILVIVGYTKISDEKKLEADKLTVQQIETAAEQYFSTNYFYVDYMKKNPDAKVFVNLALLVQNDYLNVTTKTSSEEKYDSCDIVYATYSASKGLGLNYMAFNDVFKDDSKKVFGYTSDIGLSYTEYLKTLGLTNDGKKACDAVVFTASDVNISVVVDEKYYKETKNKNIQNFSVGNDSWYNDDVPLLITVTNKDNDNHEKNEIDTVEIKLNGEKVNTNELKGSTVYKKIYRITANNNNSNSVSVSASTKGGKEASITSIYYIDKEAPTLQMLAYKTNDTSITNTVPNFNTADNIASNTWINASSNKKNIYMYIKVNDNISGINDSSLTCTRISDEGADANKEIKSTNNKTYNKLYFLKNDKVVTYECEGRDAVGNLSGKQTFTIKRDVTNPDISLVGYYSSDSNISKLTINNLDNSIKNYGSYSSNSWTNQSVVLKVTKGDNKSGVKTHSCTNPQDNSKFTHWSRVYGNVSGQYNYSCTIEDNAGNTASTSFIVKRDITNPTINVTINKCDYNSSTKQYTNCSTYSNNSWSNKNVNTTMTASDTGSGIDYSCYAAWGATTDSNCEGTKEYRATLSRGIRAEGTSYIGYAACDKAGNCLTINNGSPTYTVNLDRTAPTCSVQTKGNVKTVTYSNYKYNVTTDEKTNQTGWYSDTSINISLSSKSDSLSGIDSYGLVNSSTKSYNSKESDTHTTQTSSTTWYGYVKDKAGNENSCSRSLKNDYEAPTVEYDAGPVECKGTDGSKHSWGFSFKFKDNLSKMNLRMTEYYSASSCKKFDWFDNNGSKNSSGPEETIYSSFSRCDNNPNPRMKFILKDEAGNVYNKGEAKVVKANGKENTNTDSCKTDRFYTFD